MGQKRATRFKPFNPLIIIPILLGTNFASFQWGTMGRIGRVIREVTLRFGEETDVQLLKP
jgi:hypothetical protein